MLGESEHWGRYCDEWIGELQLEKHNVKIDGNSISAI